MADEVRQAPAPDYNELGVSGTRILSGLVFEEYNPDLTGLKAFNKWQEMRFDATCAAGYKAVELPLRSAEHFVEPASDDPKDIEKADFIHHNLWDFGSQSMDDVLRLALTMLPFGFSWMEIIYGQISQGEFAGKVGWDRFAWRSQMTKWRWNMGELDGRQELLSVTQLAPPYYAQIDIPRNKLLLFIHNQEGDNYDGWSLFRPAYKNYFYRDLLYKVQAIGLERAYMGIPVVKFEQAFSAELKALALSIVQGLRTDENAGVTLPPELGLEMLSTKLGAGKEMQDAIVYHDRQILKSMLAQWLDLGSSGSSGSWALSNDHSELFLYAINAEANYIDEVFNLDPGIPQLIRFNYPDWQSSDMPRLTHGRIGQQSLEQLGRTLEALGKFGFVTPDDATEDAFRQMLDLPEREETMTPEALKSLITMVAGRMARGRKHPNPRPAPPPPAGATPATPGQPGQPAADIAPDMDNQGADLDMAEGYQMIRDAMLRMPWPKPSRMDPIRRAQAMAAEEFGAVLQSFREPSKAPELPSIRAARMRRPYRLRDTDRFMGAEDSEVVRPDFGGVNPHAGDAIRRVQAKRGSFGPSPKPARAVGKTVTLHQAVLDKAKPDMAALLRSVGQRKARLAEAAASVPPDGGRPVELLRRDPAHVHDQNGKVDDQPCVAFDLNSTITPELYYPLSQAPYPGVKQLLDRLSSQGCCIHVTTAGLYVGDDHDLPVQQARLAMCDAYATQYGLPVDCWLPKAPADAYVDDRMVPMPVNHDMVAVGEQIDAVLARRFSLGEDGIWHRLDNAEGGHPITDWPAAAEMPQDQPRGFSGPVVDIDVHGTTLDATSSARSGPPVEGAQEAIAHLYDMGVTVQLSCAGWNPATKDDPAEIEQRLAAQRQQLRAAGIPYDRLVSKDHCECYVDDKGVAFTSWAEAMPQILRIVHSKLPGDRPTPTATPGDVDE